MKDIIYVVPHLRSGIVFWYEVLGLHPRLHCVATP